MSAADATEPAPLRLLGAPQLLVAGRWLPFSTERPYLLLAVLACRRGWVRRDELADLLYPGRDLESARSNLRKVLFLARKVEGVGVIEQRGDLLRWAPDSDLQRFEDACDARRNGDAVAAYGGPLLLGLEGAWPAGAGDWLDAERQRLQSRWHEACLRRLAELADDPESSRALAQRMLQHDPLDDMALQALGRAEQALGRTEAALAAVAGFAQRLSAELQMAPSAAVLRLESDLRQAAPAAPPTAGRPIIGRRQESTLARARLADPGCRVLTLLGPPGVGKSALARTLAAEHGAAWVALEDAAQDVEVPHRMAPALGLSLDGALPPWEALARALAGRAARVALDGCEHLALAAPLERLLAACPGLQVLAASRAALGVAGEWRLPLEGLPLPDADERDPEVLRANDAARLFEQRALPLAPGFDLGAEAAEVVALLHEVDGLPLAIELLAAWRRLMPVREIRAELAGSLDLLEPTQPGERSVRASFARSWQQLQPVEQRVLSQLALLPGPCGRELLRSVLQAPLPVLAALVDRSLLRAGDDGRFTLHPLIRRCAEPLAGNPDEVRERHARHLARTLVGQNEAGDDDLPHLRAAWHWAMAHADAPLLAAMQGPYSRLLQRRALWSEGIAALRDLVALLKPLLPPAGQAPAAGRQTQALRALAAALGQCAGFCYQTGALDAALQAARESDALARQLRDAPLEAMAAQRIGAVHWQRGDYAAARAAFMRQVERMATQPDAQVAQARAASWLALVDKAEGDYAAALARYEQAIGLLREAGQLPTHLYLMNNLGNLLRLLQRPAQALQVLHEGLQLARRHGFREDEPFLLTNIALVHESDSALDPACRWAEQAVVAATRHGEPMIEIAARLTRARCVAAARRDATPGLPDLRAALAIAARLRSPPLQVEALIAAGVVLGHGGQLAAGLAVLRWGQAQPECSPSERSDAERHLRRLAPDAAVERQAASLLAPHAPVDDVLALLPPAARP